MVSGRRYKHLLVPKYEDGIYMPPAVKTKRSRCKSIIGIIIDYNHKVLQNFMVKTKTNVWMKESLVKQGECSFNSCLKAHFWISLIIEVSDNLLLLEEW